LIIINYQINTEVQNYKKLGNSFVEIFTICRNGFLLLVIGYQLSVIGLKSSKGFLYFVWGY
jgi:hypothetical protein